METPLHMYETFGAAYPLESFYSMNNMSHSSESNPGAWVQFFAVIWYW